MENLIQFIEFETTKRGRQLEKNSFSVWYNLNGKIKSYGTTFSNDIKTDKKGIRVGKIGDDLCFVFTNDKNAIRIYGKQDRKNIVFNSKGFCEMIFPNLIIEKTGKNRKIYNLKKVSETIYLVIK